MDTIIKTIEIEVGNYILFFRGIGAFDCIVTFVTEKAVKVDYENRPAMSSPGEITVYNRCAWIPKAALIQRAEDCKTFFDVKNWFRFSDSRPIKRYYIENNKKIFV